MERGNQVALPFPLHLLLLLPLWLHLTTGAEWQRGVGAALVTRLYLPAALCFRAASFQNKKSPVPGSELADVAQALPTSADRGLDCHCHIEPGQQCTAFA